MPVKFDPALLPPAPNLSFENDLWHSGIRFVAGVDEAGRGALAGPVAAAALIFPPEPSLARYLEGVNDSKKLTPEQRAFWSLQIRQIALAWEVGLASHVEIDKLGIVPATKLAMERAIQRLRLRPGHVLIDYLILPDLALPQTPLVKGDQRSLSIAAASILAKTARDTILCQLDLKYRGYNFAIHKGYGTPDHRAAIERLGPSAVHRLSFKLS